MTPEPTFESMSYKPLLVDDNFTVNQELDPDVNFFQSISSLDAKYLSINETKHFVNTLDSNSFSVLHLNIRSMK